MIDAFPCVNSSLTGSTCVKSGSASLSYAAATDGYYVAYARRKYASGSSGNSFSATTTGTSIFKAVTIGGDNGNAPICVIIAYLEKGQSITVSGAGENYSGESYVYLLQ